MTPPQRYGGRLAGALIAGALAGGAATVVTGFALVLVGMLTGDRRWATAFREFLVAGGWAWIPLWTAALAALGAQRAAPTSGARAGTLALAFSLAALPLVFRPAYVEIERQESPETPDAKRRAILKWSYRTPETVASIVALSRDPDPRVREQAVLALGVNRVVSDIEHASDQRPAKYLAHPVRDSLRIRLLEALHDPAEEVRVEAARALWKSPLTFGTQPAAAETLAHVLGRALRPGAIERLSWLALDAAAGASHAELRAATARFAAATPDTTLRRAAEVALARR